MFEEFDDKKIFNNLIYLDDFTTCMGFANNKKEGDINLHKDTIVINSESFLNCKIENINVSNMLEIIGKHAFAHASIKNVEIKNTIRLGEGVFFDANIKNMILNTTYCTDFLFCESKLGKLKLKNTTSIGRYAFQYVIIENLSLPTTLRKIYQYAFYGTVFKNKNLAIPNGVDAIFNNAFVDTNLKEIFLPNSITHLDENFIDDKVLIVTNKDMIKRFPFLEKKNILIKDIDFLIENNKSFKEINTIYKKINNTKKFGEIEK